MARVELKNIAKSYGDVEVINSLSLDIEDGSFTVLVGPSGCGKSTLLRMIGGLEDISGGDLIIEGQKSNQLEPIDRGVAMVFQNYALYPNMTVRKNIGFPLRMAGLKAKDVHEKVGVAARSLQIEHLLERKPGQLSGGQRQRVAIGRAIVREPKVFLFDEPLSNLDAELRVTMRVEIARLHQEIDSTMIYVTHDQTEAMTLADKIVVLRDGKIEQVGTPQELYNTPANEFVAGFIGSPKMNFFEANCMQNGTVELACGGEYNRKDNAKKLADNQFKIGIRAESFVDPKDADGIIEAKVMLVEYLGGTRFVHAQTSHGELLIVEDRDNANYQIGEISTFGYKTDSLHEFSSNGIRI